MTDKDNGYPGLLPATQETGDHIGKDCEIAGRAGADSQRKSINNVTRLSKKAGKEIANAAKSVGNNLKKLKIKHFF